VSGSLLRTIKDDKTLETTKTAVKDIKTCEMTTGGATAFFFFAFMVMVDFTWWPDAEEEAGKSPLSTNHAATRCSSLHLLCSVTCTQPPDLEPYIYLIELGLPAISD
jgi:hypothetical protein